MRLHEDQALFNQAIQATAQRMAAQGKEIPEIFIEKDYWVTVALHLIFHGGAKEFAIFKGGTALSKCHRLIERFSEDIDMVVVRTEGDSANTLKNKLRAISKSVEPVLPEIEQIGITNKKGMIRKTVHQYPKTGLQGVYGQIGQDITIESSWLATFEPHVKSLVSCYITEMMEASGQKALIEQ
jgi:predicted nucleotidyltransferase component of viral defense system